jgi:hypothetical protein
LKDNSMSHDTALNDLKSQLQAADEKQFEKLVAALFGVLLDCNVFVSKSGSQFGADAGTASSAGINIRFECKRYASTTDLDERGLLGQIEQAHQRNSLLEAWVLVTTRNVTEQLDISLTLAGDRLGLSVIIVDWQSHEFPRLAALCTIDPNKVGEFISPSAQALVEELVDAADPYLERLRTEIRSWCLGYVNLQRASHQYLQRIWTDERFSYGRTGQNMSGGSSGRIRIRREASYAAISTWWRQSETHTALAIVGREGTGKTWACVDWLANNLSHLPIVLLVNASLVPVTRESSEVDVVELIAGHLQKLSDVRNLEYWKERVKRLLASPVDSGPMILLYVDGLNERRSVQWIRLVQAIQETDLCDRIRLALSTRPDHFSNDLRSGRICHPHMTTIKVGPFDKSEGDELDQLLQMHGVSRTDFTSQLIDICCNARLLTLVIRLRSSLNGLANVTVHRVLWEYGRDEIATRSHRAFSTTEWSEWLKQVASDYRSGFSLTSRASIEESVHRPSLNQHEVYQRISEIIDGQFAETDEFGNVELDAAIVEHALGLQLVSELSRLAGAINGNGPEAIQKFLEPISGLDVFADVLRAAVNISICTPSITDEVRTFLVSEWLQCQNFPDSHAEDILSLAIPLCPSLLNYIERESSHIQERAWSNSLAALQLAISSGGPVQQLVLDRIVSWFKVIPLNLKCRASNAQFEARQRSEIEVRIGSSRPGERRILELDFILTDDANSSRMEIAVQLIQKIPLQLCKRVIERFAVIHSIVPQDRIFRQLKWICLLNQHDNARTNSMLRELAKDVLARAPEAGVSNDLPAKCASTLLWLSTEQADAEEAERIRPAFGRGWDYESDYLSDPLNSLIALERRHVNEALGDMASHLFGRVRRAQEFFVDPTMQYPADFAEEVASDVRAMDTTNVDSGLGQTESDYAFDIFLPAIAAVTPTSLHSLVCKRVADINNSQDKTLYWRVMRSVQCFIAIDDSAIAYEQLMKIVSSFDGQDRWLTQSHLLFHQLFTKDALDQCSALLNSDLDGLLNNFAYILRRISSEEADRLVREFGDQDETVRLHLLVLYSFGAFEISSDAFNWIFREALSDAEKNRSLAFLVLARLSPYEFGKRLWESNWKWQREFPAYEAQYGSLALIHGTVHESFEDVAPRITPGLMLYAMRYRGSKPAEIALGRSFLQAILDTSPVLRDFELPFDVVMPQELHLTVNVRLDYGNDLPEFTGTLTDHMISGVNARRREANERFRDYINETQKKGGDLLLSPIDPRDIVDCLIATPEFGSKLLEGMEHRSTDFRRRVQRAEMFFLALCESLLKTSPETGCQLWKALGDVLQTRYIGAAEVSELLHIIFRVQDSPQVESLRLDLLDLSNCNTDKQIFEIALASQYNGKDNWLASQISQDRSSPVHWRNRRSYVLEAFTTGNPITLSDAWPCEPITTEMAELQHWSARKRVHEAFSRHWWREYVNAPDYLTAYRAWILFLKSSDRRAYVFLRNAANVLEDKSELSRRKWAHLKLNKHNMKRAFEENEKNLAEKFLHRSVSKEILPWRNNGRFDI